MTGKLFLLVSLAASLSQAGDVAVLGSFEEGVWPGVQQSSELSKQGRHSGKWVNLKADPRINVPNSPSDWSGYDRLRFWIHSEKANGQRLTIVCDSENKKDKTGWDYFYYHFRVNWEGWKLFDLKLGSDIRASRKPKGWSYINYLSFCASGWQNVPLADTVLHLDDVKLVRSIVRAEVQQQEPVRTGNGRIEVSAKVLVSNRSAKPRRFRLASVADSSPGRRAFKLIGIPTRTSPIPAGKSLGVPIGLEASAAMLRECEPLSREDFCLEVHTMEAADHPDSVTNVTVAAVVPLPRREHPFLFATSDTFGRAQRRAGRFPWAKGQIDAIVRAADGALKTVLTVPDEPGQWGHHYVCKKCGDRLGQKGGKHVCRRCAAAYTGWPYDQVIVARVHGRNWRDVRALGLAYAFTGDESYARRARENLLGYAQKYATYPLHNVWGRKSRSAARVFAQTLDESVSIIGVAWGYDLIYNSPCLSPSDREQIETGFLREVVKTVRRNNAGISNWQSWHNAGIAAVGFCLQDSEIASLAISGKSGLRFQLSNSVLPDGFWYEGAAAYHYYALDALRHTTEAARGAGIDFYANAAYKSLFDAPLLYVMPDLRFPAVNDSDVFSIRGRHALYELAYARFGDPKYLTVARHGRRGSLEALLWGADELPSPPSTALESRDFAGLGAAVMREGEGAEQWYVHLDYGSHGGGHGHPDKLAVIICALGSQLAPDPGRLPYAAPLHRSWYKQTFAHNTVCVDGKSQSPATGRLTLFESHPGFSIAQAECDTAYKSVLMRRTLVLTEDYLIDVFAVESEAEHTYDWVYHNYGELKPDLPVEPVDSPAGESHGYQHMKDVRSAATDKTWSARFAQPDTSVCLTMAGGERTEVHFGMGIGHRLRPCPMLFARRQAKATTFVSVVEPYRGQSRVKGIRRIRVEGDEGAVAFEISHTRGRDVLMLARDTGSERHFGGCCTTGRACWVRFGDGDRVVEYHVHD